MTREQIEKEARTKMSSYYADDEYPHCIKDIESDFIEAFSIGAQWRINSVWHDGNVFCQPRRKTLVIFKNGNAAVYNDLRDLTYEILWGEVERFSYLDDLLPERKEETE